MVCSSTLSSYFVYFLSFVCTPWLALLVCFLPSFLVCFVLCCWHALLYTWTNVATYLLVWLLFSWPVACLKTFVLTCYFLFTFLFTWLDIVVCELINFFYIYYTGLYSLYVLYYVADLHSCLHCCIFAHICLYGCLFRTH